MDLLLIAVGVAFVVWVGAGVAAGLFAQWLAAYSICRSAELMVRGMTDARAAREKARQAR